MIKSNLLSLLTLIKIILGNKKKFLFILILCQILVGFSPTLLLYLSANAVENIVNYPVYVKIVITLGVFILFSEILEILEGVISSILQDISKINLKNILVKKSSLTSSIEHFEDSNYQSLFFLTEQNINEISDFIGQASFFMIGLIGLLSVTILLSSLDWWIPLLIIIGTIPVVYSKFLIERDIWNIEANNSNAFKYLTISYEALTRSEMAKEVRLGSYNLSIYKNWHENYITIIEKIFKERLRGIIKITFYSIPGIILLIIPFVYIGSNFDSKVYSTAQIIYLFGAILQTRSSLQIVIANFGSLSTVLFSSQSVLSLISYNTNKTDKRVFSGSHKYALLLENVSFKYSNQKKSILDNLNFQVSRNKITAIVGSNGSGKSTIFNLLNGFFNEFSGTITIGVDHPQDILAINQGHNLPPVTLRDLLNPSHRLTDKLIKEELINGFPDLIDKLDYYIDSRFENFIELSGGQWQKLLLIKVKLNICFYRLIVLDETNSALDQKSDEFYIETLLKIKNKATVIIITHKSEILKYCDNIIKLS